MSNPKPGNPKGRKARSPTAGQGKSDQTARHPDASHPKARNPDASRRFPLLFYIVAVLSPILILIVIELGLILSGFGAPQSYYVLDPTGRTYIANPDVSYRYFSKRSPLVPTPAPSEFPAHKESTVTRIFCLGESTTRGFPYGANASFSVLLSDRLARTFPANNFEVVNTSIDATMSHTILEIAREVMRYEPDLVILYMGHNEFQGALGAGSGGLLARNRNLARAYLRLLDLRTFRVLHDAFEGVIGAVRTVPGGDRSVREDSDGGQTLMEVMARNASAPFGSPEYRAAVRTFRQNLEEIAGVCRESDVPLVVCTLVSNLKDQAPFRSLFSHETNEADIREWESRYQEAETEFDRGEIDLCLARISACVEIDSMPARAWYLKGRCLLAAGDSIESRIALERARDLDALRFRAPTEFNEIIRGLADSKTVFLTDVEAAFNERSQHGIPGHELLFEHVHPRAAGYSLIAERLASTLRTWDIPQNLDWTRHSEPDQRTLQEEWSVTEIDEGLAALRVAILEGQWPFTNEPRKPTWHAKNLVDRLVARVQMGDLSLEEAHVQLGDSLATRGDFTAASTEYLAAAKCGRPNAQIWIRLGDAYQAASNPTRAEWAWTRGHALSPLEGFELRLGSLALENDRPSDAASYLRMASMPPGDLSAGERATAHYLLIRALLELRDAQGAVEEIERASRAYPGDPRVQELREWMQRGGQ